jgi:hypothetical protein
MRTVAVGLWALLCAASAWAQMPSLPVLEKGLRVGIGWNTFIGADAERIGGRLGPSIGVFAAVELLPEIALQPELLYSRRTAVQEIVLGESGYDLEYDLAYLELGLPIRLRREVAGYTMYGLLGPVLALRLSGKLNQRVGGGTPFEQQAEFATFDVRGLLAVGTELPLRRSARLFVDARLGVGALPVFASEFKPPLREEKPLRKLQLLSAGVSVGFGF